MHVVIKVTKNNFKEDLVMSVIKDVIAKVKQTDPNQPEFHQAVEEVMETLEPTVKKHPEYVKANIYERLVEPERAMQFRVP